MNKSRQNAHACRRNEVLGREGLSGRNVVVQVRHRVDGVPQGLSHAHDL